MSETEKRIGVSTGALDLIKSDRSRLENAIDNLIESFADKHGFDACQISVCYGEIKCGPGDRTLSSSGYGSFITVRL